MTTRKRKESVSWRKSTHGRRAIGYILTFALLVPLGIAFILPFFVMVSTALKPLNQVFAFPPRLIPGNSAVGELRRRLVRLRLR